MSKQLSDETIKDLLDAIADGLPIGALSGVAGLSAPTLTARMYAPDFMQRIADVVKTYDDDAVELLERLEHWWQYDGERAAAYRLRQRVAKAIRRKFAAEDEAEQEAARRPGASLNRGGIAWRWSKIYERWEYGLDNWWHGSIGGDV